MNNLLKQRIKTYLDDKGMSIRDLERRAGLGPSSIINILNDRAKNPKASSLVAIARVIGCSVDELLYEDTDKITPERPSSSSDSADLEWKVPIAIQAIEITQEICSQKGITLNSEKAFSIVRQIYNFTVKVGREIVDKDFAEWLIDELTEN